MGRVRDFSQNAKDQLLAAIRSAEEDNEGLAEFNDFMNKSLDLNLNLEGIEAVPCYYQDLMDFHKMSKNQLENIFENVYKIEAEFNQQLLPLLEQATNLRKAMKNLADMMDPNPSGGRVGAMGLSHAEFLERMNENAVMDGLYAAIIERIFTEVDGQKVYNWDEIDAILNQRAKDITEMEYKILATIYAQMGIEDTEKFLQALADKVGDIDTGMFSSQTPRQYTEWTYDSDKVTGIQKYVDYMASELWIEQWTVSNLMSAEEIENLYLQIYPGNNGRSIEASEQLIEVLKLFDEQRWGLMQQSTFLTIVDNLSTQPTANEESNSFLHQFAEMTPLTGVAGALGPSITLEKDGDDSVLRFCNTRVSSFPPTVANNQVISSGLINNLNENVITISKPLYGANVGYKVADSIEVFYTEKYNFDFADTAVNKSGGFINDQVTSNVLDGVTDRLLAGGIESNISRFGAAVIGAIPTLGSVVSLGVDMFIDYGKERQEAEQNYNEMKAAVGAFRDANYCSEFCLEAVIISDGTANQQFMVFASPNTQNILENMNQFTQNRGIDVTQYGLKYPITLEDILGNSDAMKNFIDNEMTQTERSFVLNPENREKMGGQR